MPPPPCKHVQMLPIAEVKDVRAAMQGGLSAVAARSGPGREDGDPTGESEREEMANKGGRKPKGKEEEERGGAERNPSAPQS